MFHILLDWNTPVIIARGHQHLLPAGFLFIFPPLQLICRLNVSRERKVGPFRIRLTCCNSVLAGPDRHQVFRQMRRLDAAVNRWFKKKRKRQPISFYPPLEKRYQLYVLCLYAVAIVVKRPSLSLAGSLNQSWHQIKGYYSIPFLLHREHQECVPAFLIQQFEQVMRQQIQKQRRRRDDKCRGSIRLLFVLCKYVNCSWRHMFFLLFLFLSPSLSSAWQWSNNSGLGVACWTIAIAWAGTSWRQNRMMQSFG